MSQVPPGAIALSTRCHDESLAPIEPPAGWLDRIRAAAAERGMTRVADHELDNHGDDWGDPTTVLAEGPGISTSFFWHGQGRPLYRVAEDRVNDEVRDFEGRDRASLLSLWTAAGVRWIEMEDFTVLRIAEMCGIPAVSLGAVLGQRRRPDGRFQLAYSKQALESSELIPAELALAAIRADG